MDIQNNRIDGFDPRSYDMTKGMSPSLKRDFEKYIANGELFLPHNVFQTEEEVYGVIAYIKKYDPMLASLCLISYKYSLHPILQVATSRLNISSRVLVTGLRSRFYGRRENHLLNEDWLLIVPFLEDCDSSVFLYDARSCVSEELRMRWGYVKKKLVRIQVLNDYHSLASFYSTGLHGLVSQFNDGVDVLERLMIKDLKFANLLFESCGLEMPGLGSNYLPVDPFRCF